MPCTSYLSIHRHDSNSQQNNAQGDLSSHDSISLLAGPSEVGPQMFSSPIPLTDKDSDQTLPQPDGAVPTPKRCGRLGDDHYETGVTARFAAVRKKWLKSPRKHMRFQAVLAPLASRRFNLLDPLNGKKEKVLERFTFMHSHKGQRVHGESKK